MKARIWGRKGIPTTGDHDLQRRSLSWKVQVLTIKIKHVHVRDEGCHIRSCVTAAFAR